MLLCDIGNTSYHFLDENYLYKKSVQDFDPKTITEKVYFISVNTTVLKKLSGLSNWIDLKEFVDRSKYYETMGIDRIFAVEATSNAIILDAGSAITVDVVKNGEFLGGFIYPGINAMQKAYSDISSALEYSFNFDVDLERMPKNSQDAITYGFVKTLYSEVVSHNMPIILTGGDAVALQKIFKDATVDEKLIFKGMRKFIPHLGVL